MNFTDKPTGPIHRFLHPVPHDPCGGINDFLSLLPGNVDAAKKYLVDRTSLTPDAIDVVVGGIATALADDDDDEIEKHMQALYDSDFLRAPEEIGDACHQATARLWFSRGDKSLYRQQMEENYPDLYDYDDEWSHGYLSGVVAALRWVQGSGWADLDT